MKCCASPSRSRSISLRSPLVAGALVLLSGLDVGDAGDLPLSGAIFAILGILYLVVARQTVGSTLGEALLDVRYHPPRRPWLPQVR